MTGYFASLRAVLTEISQGTAGEQIAFVEAANALSNGQNGAAASLPLLEANLSAEKTLEIPSEYLPLETVLETAP